MDKPRKLDINESITIKDYSQIFHEPPTYMKQMLDFIKNSNANTHIMMSPRRAGKSAIASELIRASGASVIQAHTDKITERLNKQILDTINSTVMRMSSRVASSPARPSVIVYDDFVPASQPTFEERYINDRTIFEMADEPVRPIRRIKKVRADGRVVTGWGT